MQNISIVSLVKKIDLDIANNKFTDDQHKLAERIIYLAKRMSYAYCVLVKARSGRRGRLDTYKVNMFKKDIAKSRGLIFKYLKDLYCCEKDN